MPDQYIVCRRRNIARDRGHSFHKFPKHEASPRHEVCETWMIMICLEKVPSQAKVCSDHFDVSCFHGTDGYTAVKRLKSTAMPKQRLRNGENFLPHCRNSEAQQRDTKTTANLNTPTP